MRLLLALRRVEGDLRELGLRSFIQAATLVLVHLVPVLLGLQR